ncbi:MAG: thiamine pyrophosphate-binding protein [Hyphomicrobiaceae bacterium]|nr:thiamine pyrophosphate-binding protein [Hyphomicrobiaceae bacterium]
MSDETETMPAGVSDAGSPPAKVADRMAETMRRFGVRFAFGIPGNDVLELVRACEAQGIRFVLAKSEPSAAFMADAVTQVTGAPAACIFALGPGLANGVSGVAGALMERSPVLVLGGEMAGNRRQIYNHQVFDHVSLMAPVTKWAAELNPERAAQQTAKALDIATCHPPGPVFLNCPADATRAPSKEARGAAPETRAYGVLSPGDVEPLKAGLEGARRPVALVGRGALAHGGSERLRGFLESWQMPFFATYKAKGIVSDTHPLCMGAVALSPVIDDISLEFIRQADLVILVGFDPIELRDAWLDAWAPEQRVIGLDWTPQTHRIFACGEQYAGDVLAMLAQLTRGARRPCGWDGAAMGEVKQKVARIVHPREPAGRISPAGLFHAVTRRVSPDLLMTIDVGAHRILGNHVLECVAPGQLLQSNGLGCMGYAIPAAIGASLAAPGRQIVAMLGDGCALMSLGELALLAELQAPVVTVVLNDDSLALIDLKQEKLALARQGVTFASPGFAEIAKGFGIAAERVDSQSDFEGALTAAMGQQRPALIEALVDPAEYREQM